MKLVRTAGHPQLLKRLATAHARAGLTREQLTEKLQARSGWVAKYETGERSLDAPGKRTTRSP